MAKLISDLGGGLKVAAGADCELGDEGKRYKEFIFILVFSCRKLEK